MPLDPSISLQAGQGVTPIQNPLDLGMKYQGLANAMSQNKLIEANTAQTQQQTAQSGADDAAKRIAEWRALPDHLRTQATARQVVMWNVQSGATSPQAASAALAAINATKDQPALDKLADAATAHIPLGMTMDQYANMQVARGLSGADKAGQILGQNQLINDGQNQQINRVASPLQGAMNPNIPGMVPQTGAVTQKLSPGEKVQTQPVIGPNNVPGTQSVGSKYNDDGTIKPVGWGLGKGAGAYPTPSGPQAPPGFTQTGQAPGVVEGLSVAAQDAAKAGGNLQTAAQEAVQHNAQLNNFLAELQQMQKTGPGTERLKHANAITQKYGGFGLTMSADQLAATEGASKIVQQIAQRQAAISGTGTDSARGMAMGANPNMDLSKLGNEQMSDMIKGNNDYIIGQSRAYEKWKAGGGNAGDFRKFQDDFNKTYDPRAFQWTYLSQRLPTEAARRAAFNAMPNKEAVRDSYDKAVKAGLIAP